MHSIDFGDCSVDSCLCIVLCRLFHLCVVFSLSFCLSPTSFMSNCYMTEPLDQRNDMYVCMYVCMYVYFVFSIAFKSLLGNIRGDP